MVAWKTVLYEFELMSIISNKTNFTCQMFTWDVNSVGNKATLSVHNVLSVKERDEIDMSLYLF